MKRKSRPTSHTNRRHRSMRLERLENRRLMTAGLDFDGGTITIRGDAWDNVAEVVQHNGRIRVSIESVGQIVSRLYAATDVQRILFEGFGGNDKLTNETAIPTVAWGHDGDDILIGGSGGDELVGGAGNDQIAGRRGDDRMWGESGDDFLSGGSGRDLIIADAGHDVLSGGDDDDTLVGGSGNDAIDAGNGNDRVWGEAGDDAIAGGSGHDELVGGDGDDRIHGEDGNDRIWGGDGADFISGGTGNDTIEGNDGHDYLTGEQGHDRIWGHSGNDQIVGGSGSDELVGDGGDDVIAGNEGDDKIWGASGNDFLSAGSGHDDVFGGYGNDQIFGDSGDDRLRGEHGNDRVSGNSGADQLYGGAGHDQLNGGSGDDRLEGDSGNDTLAGDAGEDVVIGGDGNDFLYGGDQRDLLFGQAGDDYLSGNDGPDGLFGGYGNDTLYGGPHSDLLAGETGADLLYGGGDARPGEAWSPDGSLADQFHDPRYDFVNDHPSIDGNRAPAVYGGLSETDLDRIAAAALQNWRRAGLKTGQLNVEYRIADLHGSALGWTFGSEDGSAIIYIDNDAGGNAWFVDPTPAQSGEFLGINEIVGVNQQLGDTRQFDLLTVVSHEQGHAAGLIHTPWVSVMSSHTLPGTRVLPDALLASLAAGMTSEGFIDATQTPTPGEVILGIQAFQSLGPYGTPHDFGMIAAGIRTEFLNINQLPWVNQIQASSAFGQQVANDPLLHSLIPCSQTGYGFCASDLAGVYAYNQAMNPGLGATNFGIGPLGMLGQVSHITDPLLAINVGVPSYPVPGTLIHSFGPPLGSNPRDTFTYHNPTQSILAGLGIGIF